jgi:hypothetical protein
LPKTYAIQGGLDRLFQPTTGDRIIGSKEASRATKTYISSERGAFLIAALKSHAEGLVETVRILHTATYGKTQDKTPEGETFLRDLTDDEVCERYPGCRRWRELHQFIVEHYASQEGFAVQAAVQMHAKGALEKERAESSIQAGERDE